MKCRIYKSLDKNATLFGIREPMLRWVGAGVVAALTVGFGIVGPLLGSSLAGTAASIFLVLLVYLGVMAVQSRFSQRGLRQWLSSLRLPDVVLFPPRRLSRYNRINFHFNDKNQL